MSSNPLEMPKALKAEIDRIISQHSAAIGKVAIAWNGLQATFADLFVYLVTPHHREKGFAVWHAINSDRSQRAMVAAAVAVDPSINSDIKAEFKWAFDQMDTLENSRNDIIHAPYGIKLQEQEMSMFPDARTGHKRAKNIEKKNIKSECASAVKRFDDMHRFLAKLGDHLHKVKQGLESPSLPERPQLKSLAHATQKKQSRASRKPTKPRPPRSPSQR